MTKINIRNVQIGNAQTIGTMEHQNDYFATEITNKETLAIVCDGTTNDKSGKASAVIAVDVFINLFRTSRENTNPFTYFEEATKKANKLISDYTYLTKRSLTTLTAALIKNHHIYWLSIGNSTLNILYKGQLYNINNQSKEKISMGETPLHKTSIVMLATDGVTKNLNEIEIIQTLNTKKQAHEKSLELIETLNKKKLKQQDNATLIILQKF